jgi:predicted DNA-binding transcriptional regulator AlpA
MPNTNDTLLTRREYAAKLKIGESTAERWARLGYGAKPIRLSPRRIIYRKSEVLKFIAECEAQMEASHAASN